ncbi:DNA topoisomerase IV subunit B [Moraxella cuniculi DSM 21768]|uniref:DNA topoisomerase 4 subunit B n=1 Tax=Moraxella cuniculi DSM 21768 TaxID=1122245 RepID=A0A1N7F913_9GAMM|nr:DNA topoisomerase IV subunit B [Moraxella cuniculi]OOS03595.1 DNA topoisomerase IV subunit B [Moraxella cuniculi]SIR96819.1 DNA topoisomerase IV subunit B [Moraxella cuniculi DSM 21768]
MSAYTSQKLEVLEGLEPVRRRPGMYTDTTRPNHLAQEVIDNSVDEALAGFARHITVVLHTDGSLSVEDDGRGMPTDIHPEFNQSGVELILTRLHAGGKFSTDNYQVSGGLHGVGISVVNALSTKVAVTVWRDGLEHRMLFEQGQAVTPLLADKAANKKKRGTKVQFWVDERYFDNPKFAIKALKHNLKAKAVLCTGLQIDFISQIDPADSESWQFSDGVVQYLTEQLDGLPALPDEPFYFSVEPAKGERGGATFALSWLAEGGTPVTESYVNLIPTAQGGTHVNGLRTGVLEALREFCDIHNLLPRNVKLSGEDVWDGVNYILSLKFVEPQFSGQTKERLSSREAAPLMQTLAKDAFSLWLNQHPDSAKAIAELVIGKATKRLATAQKVARKKVAQGPALPGKLWDCRGGLKEGSELFLVEGQSAGGSAKQARDNAFQAILPLRGKILNTWEVSSDTVLSSQEIHDIAIAIGVDPASDDLSELRYDKICILADADSDGLHIATLICALFVRHFPALIEAGHLYVAVPPLYRVDAGKEVHYALDNEELEQVLAKLGNKKPQITRFKGLGEMNPNQLRETTMNPDTRKLVRLDLDDIHSTNSIMDKLLAKKRSADRKQWLETKGDLADLAV